MRIIISIAVLACACGCVTTPDIDQHPIAKDLQSVHIWMHAFTNSTIHAIAEEIEDDANAVLPEDQRISIRISPFRRAPAATTQPTDSAFHSSAVPSGFGNVRITPWHAILSLRDVTALDLEIAEKSRTIILFSRDTKESANKSMDCTSQ